jgi:hypothetical protein
MDKYEELSALFRNFCVISHFSYRFKALSFPEIYEEMNLTQWKYVLLLSSKFEIKPFELCDATTGYL